MGSANPLAFLIGRHHARNALQAIAQAHFTNDGVAWQRQWRGDRGGGRFACHALILDIPQKSHW
jgi:hypothetical protein